ncbi:glycogen synthase GlgA [Bacillus cytotoxicus]|uniref:Glycogen synthase n=1 Tax=Bacillus cytotoxicus TaxID=580165 RepID=A0AAX2CMF2_9BACI|nr:MULTISPECIES: glycogen synthase GlgA [Bacillus cereus group]AWC34348.1 glycogen synthase [Bacillus cytotoxicus]AWC38346.1 glycogen synthase [Bacillus cytotoxicus]AWC62564.1 glycogen synthase [Bacillus cytotoxicus]KMT51728.1 glycogen synthase [Bacillus cytotoxicus]MDH2881237.1 glycogen synthase GlgA [Bacillus cytotoxicus]
MNILFAVSECVPFIKSGGLADVAGALPKELKKLGVNVRIMLPNYSLIPANLRESFKLHKVIHVPLGWRNQYCGILKGEQDGITYYLIDNEYYFKRDSLYGHYDDGERFSFFSKAILESIPYLDFEVDLIHSHDWHTAMVNFLLHEKYKDNPLYEKIKTVYTIHNLQFQGVFPREVIHDLLELGDEYFNSEQLEFYGNINFMKGGIIAADHITTVSSTYKEEIQYEFFGEKLDGLLRKYNDKLSGIVNGIDTSVYNPRLDSYITATYDVDTLYAKRENKWALQHYFGLPEKENTPIISMVTRLTKQKGLDLVRAVFQEIMQEDVQCIILGSGDSEYEQFFEWMAYEYSEKVKVYIGFNEELAHQVYAGSDLFLMPSLFEPCGLGQLIALAYGVIPIVRETGGLNDTVKSYHVETKSGNGFTFTNFNAHDMLYTVRRALRYYEDPAVWNQLVKQAMTEDHSWKTSALAYKDLYNRLLKLS